MAVFTYIHLDDDEPVKHDFDGHNHAIAIGNVRILAKRDRLAMLAAVLAASMEEEDAACG